MLKYDTNISNTVTYLYLNLEHKNLNYCCWKYWTNIYIYIYIYVVEWSRALDVRLSEWCCSVSMVLVQIPSREEHKFDSSKI